LEILEERAQQLERELGISSTGEPSSGTPTSNNATEKNKAAKEEKVASEVTAPQADPGKEPAPSEKPSPEALLAKAKDHLVAGREVAAEAALRRHFSLYPKERTHTEALYRYAEASFNQKNFQEAATRFQDVLNANAKSAFAAWALFRQGECFAELGDEESAKTFYEDVVKDYPKSKASAEAKKKLSK
jgi:tol-pal system protein YbgF